MIVNTPTLPKEIWNGHKDEGDEKWYRKQLDIPMEDLGVALLCHRKYCRWCEMGNC